MCFTHVVYYRVYLPCLHCVLQQQSVRRSFVFALCFTHVVLPFMSVLLTGLLSPPGCPNPEHACCVDGQLANLKAQGKVSDFERLNWSSRVLSLTRTLTHACPHASSLSRSHVLSHAQAFFLRNDDGTLPPCTYFCQKCRYEQQMATECEVFCLDVKGMLRLGQISLHVCHSVTSSCRSWARDM